jgi:hypothetical protein
MSNIITFMDFKKLLNNKNIYLFDGEYRIAHYQLNKLINKSNNNQTGGSIIDTTNILDKVNKLNSVRLLHFVNAIIANNKEKINWILLDT